MAGHSSVRSQLFRRTCGGQDAAAPRHGDPAPQPGPDRCCLGLLSTVGAESAPVAAHRDRIGMVCSGLCLVHCLAPVLLTLFGSSLTGLALFGNENLHLLLLVAVAAVAAWSLLPAYRVHRRWLPSLLALPGVSLLLSAVLLGGAAEVSLTVAGGMLMVVAHAVNLHMVRCLVTKEGLRYASD